MKVFIVFFAMLIINISFLSFNSDMDRYVKLQTHLKAIAEECASGASLFHDQEAYSKGFLSIAEAEANAYIDFVVNKALEIDPAFLRGNVNVEALYFDDSNGYAYCNEYRINKENPAVVVTLTYFGEDMFRLPFLAVNTASRTATYQWDDGLTSAF